MSKAGFYQKYLWAIVEECVCMCDLWGHTLRHNSSLADRREGGWRGPCCCVRACVCVCRILMRWDSWNKLSGFHGIFETEGQGLSHLANFSLLMETEKDTGHKHTCHPWSFDCCRTERHFSSGDSFFLSPSVGTTRSLYL